MKSLKIFYPDFMDHAAGITFLYNMGELCNTNSAVCNIRIVLHDIGALCYMRIALCDMRSALCAIKIALYDMCALYDMKTALCDMGAL